MAIYKLGEIATVNMCKRVFSNQTNKSYGIPFYKIGTIGKLADTFISEKLFNELKSKYKYPEKGDSLISASGTIGKIVEYNGEKAYFQDSNIVWLTTRLLNKKYLHYWLNKNQFKSTSGSTINRLYNSDILLTKIYVPKKFVQQQIIDIIKPLESQIDLIKKIINKCIILRKDIYNISKFKTKKLEYLANAKSGKQPSLNYHINTKKIGYKRFIQNRDYADYKIKSYIPSNFKGTEVREMDIVIDKYGEPGKMRYGINGFINVAMLKINPFKDKYKESIRNFFESENILKWLKTASQASTRPSLNWNFLKTIDIGLSDKNDLLLLLLSLELKFKKIDKEIKKIKNKFIKILIM